MGYKEINADTAPKISADTFRINYSTSDNGDFLKLDFGKFVEPKEAEQTVDVKAYVEIPMGTVLGIITTMFATAVDYQKATGKNIGFPDKIAKKGE